MASLSCNNKEPAEETLRDVFRCFICMEKLCEAHLCPHCSKLCCYLCISKWLTEQRRQCPHCRATLSVSELVNCRWLEDVAVQVESLQQICANMRTSTDGSTATTPRDLCRSHQEKLSVYCFTCKHCICHQCALWGGTHSGHTFKKIELVYESHVAQVRTEVNRLQLRLRELAKSVEEVEMNVMVVREAKEERVKEIRTAVDQMIGRLDAQLKVKLMTLMRHKRFLTKETEQLERLVQEIDYQVEASSPSQLIGKSPELLQLVMQAQVKSTDENNYTAVVVPPDFTSELVPQYDTCTFLIERFTPLQLDGLAVYSKPLLVNGLCWRLKVYPCGNGPARGEFLSVFLELTSGHPGSSKYEYRVQMQHELASKEISREFVSDFEIGECWGYNRFFPLDLLASEGYLNTRLDTLELRFQVRPSTFFQRCREQQWHIHQLVKTGQQQATEIAELKQQLERERTKSQLLLVKSSHKEAKTKTKMTATTTTMRQANSNSNSARDRWTSFDQKSSAEANEKIFSEILKCLSPSITTSGNSVGKQGQRPSTAPASSSSSSSLDKNEASTPPSAISNDFIDMTLLTESSDEDGAVGGDANSSSGSLGLSALKLTSAGRTLSASSSTDSDNEDDEISNRRTGLSFLGDDDAQQGGENLVEYSEVLVPATTSSFHSADSSSDADLDQDAGRLVNLLVDLPAAATTPSRSANGESQSARGAMKSGDRMSYYQPIRSASVLETLLEPPRLSSGPLVSYLTQGTNGMSSAPRVRSSGVGSEMAVLPAAAHEVDEVISSFCQTMMMLNQPSTLTNLMDNEPRWKSQFMRRGDESPAAGGGGGGGAGNRSSRSFIFDSPGSSRSFVEETNSDASLNNSDEVINVNWSLFEAASTTVPNCNNNLLPIARTGDAEVD